MRNQKTSSQLFWTAAGLIGTVFLTSACSHSHIAGKTPQGAQQVGSHTERPSELNQQSSTPARKEMSPNNNLSTAERTELTRLSKVSSEPGHESEFPDKSVTALTAKETTLEQNKVSEELLIQEPLKTDSQLAIANSLGHTSQKPKEDGVMLAIQPPQPRVLFYPFDGKKLNTEQLSTIEQHANFLAVHPEYTIQIHGHTDARGNDAYNKELSVARAQTVANQLLAAGAQPHQIEVFGWSSDDPLLSASQYDKNRRVELIYLTGQLTYAKKTGALQEIEELTVD